MARTAWLVIAGVVAGAVGYYAGLFLLLAVTGLDAAGWAPVAQLAGAGTVGGLVIGLLSEASSRSAWGLSIGGAVVGALLGAAVGELRDGFEWAIVAGVGLVTAMAMTAQRLAQ